MRVDMFFKTLRTDLADAVKKLNKAANLQDYYEQMVQSQSRAIRKLEERIAMLEKR